MCHFGLEACLFAVFSFGPVRFITKIPAPDDRVLSVPLSSGKVVKRIEKALEAVAAPWQLQPFIRVVITDQVPALVGLEDPVEQLFMRCNDK